MLIKNFNINNFNNNNNEEFTNLISDYISSKVASFIKRRIIKKRIIITDNFILLLWLCLYSTFKNVIYFIEIYFTGVYYKYRFYILISNFLIDLIHKIFFSSFLVLRPLIETCEF